MARMLQVTPSSVLQEDPPAAVRAQALIVEARGRVGGVYVPTTASTPPLFAGKNVSLFDIVLRMDGLGSFDRESRDSMLIRLGRMKVRVLPLARIIASKKAANRAKDRLILPVLEDALATLKKAKKTRPRAGRRV